MQLQRHISAVNRPLCVLWLSLDAPSEIEVYKIRLRRSPDPRIAGFKDTGSRRQSPLRTIRQSPSRHHRGGVWESFYSPLGESAVISLCIYAVFMHINVLFLKLICLEA